MSEQPPEGLQAGDLGQLKSIYINGFGVALGNCDVSIVAQNNGKSLFLMNLSYTVAKTLAQELAKTIDLLEKSSGRQIMTAQETAGFLSKVFGGSSEKQ